MLHNAKSWIDAVLIACYPKNSRTDDSVRTSRRWGDNVTTEIEDIARCNCNRSIAECVWVLVGVVCSVRADYYIPCVTDHFPSHTRLVERCSSELDESESYGTGRGAFRTQSFMYF